MAKLKFAKPLITQLDNIVNSIGMIILEKPKYPNI